MRKLSPQQNFISPFLPDRQGTILIWFAIFLFALFPLAALIVDFGLVTLTRRQMQAAVNTAALEGLRFRDSVLSQWDDPDPRNRPEGLSEACPGYAAPPSSGQSPSEKRKKWCDCARRWAVGNLVENLFDDGLNPGEGDSMQFGAGPVLELSDGIQFEGTEFYASQIISPGQSPVYKPQLQMNRDDVAEGDMVAGQWQETIPPDHSEDEDYLRGDFASKMDSRYVPANPDDSFLVRLRRTNPQHGPLPEIDNRRDVSSSRWTLPSLFGRGGITRAENRSDPAALWNQREYGTPVWATAIAGFTPALIRTVGVAYASTSDTAAGFYGSAGVASFRFPKNRWKALISEALSLPDDPDNSDDTENITITLTSMPDGSIFHNGISVAHFVDWNPATPEVLDRKSTSIGLALHPDDLENPWGLYPHSSRGDLKQDESLVRFAPITDQVNGQERVIGFAGLIVTLPMDTGESTQFDFTIQFQPTPDCPFNVSGAVLSRSSEIDPQSWRQVIEANLSLSPASYVSAQTCQLRRSLP